MDKKVKPSHNSDRYVLLYKASHWRYFRTCEFSTSEGLILACSNLVDGYEHGSYRWFSLSDSHMEASFEW